MGEKLHSVGIDVGTSTTQLIVSRLTVENRANAYAVPDFTIADREILYRSPIHFTPLRSATELDAEGIRQIVAEEYRQAGIRPEAVSTGAIIITGETARKENARAVLDSLKEFAGEFVVATAGPDLESVLAAKGAGAERFSAQTGRTVLHMDIGGGTSNLALAEGGRITQTGCLNVGGRLIKIDRGAVQYVSPVLQGLCSLTPGQPVTEADLAPVIELLVQTLETAAGLRTGEIPPGLLTNRRISLPPVRLPCHFPAVWRISSGRVPGPLCVRRHRRAVGQRHPAQRSMPGRLRLGGGNHPGDGNRRRLPQHPAVRQHGVRPGRDVPPAKPAGHCLDRPGAGPARLPPGSAGGANPGPVGGGLSGCFISARNAESRLRYAVRSGRTSGRGPAAVGKSLGRRHRRGYGKGPGAGIGHPPDRSLLCLDGLELPDGSFLDVAAPVAAGTAYPVVKDPGLSLSGMFRVKSKGVNT